MFEKKTDEMLSTESNWDIIIHHQEQWHPTGGGVTARANTAINVSSPVIYYAGDDKYTGHHIKDKIETVDPAAKVCNIVVRYFNNLSLLLKPV
jgi:dTDP-glucose pyrophosphorylase